MRIYRLRRQCLTFITTVVVAGCSYANEQSVASDNTWGKTDYSSLEWQSEGPRKTASAWRKPDGAHAAVIQVPADHGWTQDNETDTKGVVLSGRIEIADTILTSGSYWARPGGTRTDLVCKRTEPCIVYLETEPTVDAISPTVIAAADIPWFEVPNTYGNVFLAWVWGKPESADPSGFFLKFKAGFSGAPHTHTGSYDGIVVQGRYKHWEIDDTEIPVMPIGTPFWQAGGAPHDDACDAGQDCISYFRIDRGFDYFPDDAAAEN